MTTGELAQVHVSAAALASRTLEPRPTNAFHGLVPRHEDRSSIEQKIGGAAGELVITDFFRLTLHDAGHYAIALPKAVQERVGWRIAAEMLIAAAQGQRPVIFAEIAVAASAACGRARLDANATAQAGQDVKDRLLESRSPDRPLRRAGARRDGGDETLTDIARSYNVSHSTISRLR
jgi:hypothetical protein